MSESRSRIADAIGEDPGVHFSELVRRLELAPGQVQHHLRTLLRERDVVEERLYGRTHYYPPTVDDWEREALALLRRETANEVVTHLLAAGPSRPDDVAEKLGVARSTLSWHVDRLVEGGLVEKQRGERNRVTLVAARPTETLALLASIEPSLPARLVDRFERLVDAMLEG